MACSMLPLYEGAKFIVVDEGSDAAYARTMIAGWLKVWKDMGDSHIVELLSFFDPKSWYEHEAESFSYANVIIHDMCTLDINMCTLDIHDPQRKDFFHLKNFLDMNHQASSIMIVDCLSSLIAYVGLAKALWFLENLNRQVHKLICIYRRDIVQCKPPRMDTLGTTYVKISQSTGNSRKDNLTYLVDIVHRKIGGSVMKQTELVIQDTRSYEIQSVKVEASSKKAEQPHDNPPEKIQSSFRIEMSASEMEQREKTALPYTINTSASNNTSKIFYQPDDVDDMDEEDPDDDLCI